MIDVGAHVGRDSPSFLSASLTMSRSKQTMRTREIWQQRAVSRVDFNWECGVVYWTDSDKTQNSYWSDNEPKAHAPVILQPSPLPFPHQAQGELASAVVQHASSSSSSSPPLPATRPALLLFFLRQFLAFLLLLMPLR